MSMIVGFIQDYIQYYVIYTSVRTMYCYKRERVIRPKQKEST